MNPSIQLIHDLVNIPSVSGSEREASEFFIEQMTQRGATEAYVDEVDNAIGIWGTGEKELWMVGHIDTVPGEIPVEIKDGQLYGRGSVDAKGCLATFAEATGQIEVPTDWKLIIVGCVEEEIHTSKGARHLIKQWPDKKPEAIIIGEPSSSGKITISYKGSLRSKSIHSSQEEHSSTNTPTGPEEAVAFWNKVRTWSDEFNQEKSISQLLQTTIISIVSENNGFENKCELITRYRIPVGLSSQDIENQVREFFNGQSIDFYGHEEPILSEKNTPLVKAFLKAMRAKDIQPRFSKKTGTADMNVLGNYYKGIPIVAYGPGDSKLDHTPNEHLDLEDYEKSIGVLTAVLKQLTNA